MKASRILLAVALVVLLGVNAYAVAQYGVAGFFDLAAANAVVVSILVDLTIALTLVTVWMWRDAHQRGASVVPHVLLTLGLGSVGPLVYLLGRPADEPARGHAAARAA
jgi:hypothetical protein